MGQFTVTVTLLPNEGAGTGPRRVDALVDTGAAYTVVPRPLAESLGCRPHRAQAVRFAGGRVEEWPVAEVRVECEGRRATTTVLMGPAAGPVLMGAITLDGQRSSGIGDRRRSRGAVRRVCRPRRPLPGRRAAARDRSLRPDRPAPRGSPAGDGGGADGPAAIVRRKLQRIAASLDALRPIARLSLEEQEAIEAALDVNAHLAAELGGEVPEEYDGGFLKIGQLGVVPADLAGALAPSAGLRNRLVHEYETIDDAKVLAAVGAGAAMRSAGRARPRPS